MKRPTMLSRALLAQASIDLDLSVERDVATLQHRCEHEGFEFLSLILPKLSDALESGLESGRFSCPLGFKRRGRLPAFMQGFFKRVFALDGELLDDPCPISVFYIRQVCRFFKKPKMDCSPDAYSAAISHFIDVEDELRTMAFSCEKEDAVLDQVSKTIWSQVFPEIDPIDLVCHHGPGATAERKRLLERNRLTQWSQRSELLYPSDLHAYPNYWEAMLASDTRESAQEFNTLSYLELKDEPAVRVVFVPKTLVTPRVIAIEPSHMQFIQQSLKDYVYERLEKHRLTARSIRFVDQTVNQQLAHQSSVDKTKATLDLKDASDRVHFGLVQRIFKSSGILEYLEDARSLHALLPNGRNVILSKYASMGSALCFPVEAMVFYTIVQSAIHKARGIHPTSSSIRAISSDIDIYGDDIIVPVEYADVVVSELESYLLKVNVSKSFSKGNFRESCGGDFFRGEWVTPIYAREYPHDDSRDWTPSTYMSWAATSDLFYQRGMWHVAQVIRKMVVQVARRSIPRSRSRGPGLAFFSYLYSTNLRYDADLHCWKQKRLQFIPLKRKDKIDGDGLACLNYWGISTHRKQTTTDLQNSSVSRGSGSCTVRTECPDGECRLRSDGDACECRECHELLLAAQICDAGARPSSDGLSDVEPVDTRSDSHHSCTERPWTDRDYLVSLQDSKSDSLLTGRSVGLDFHSSTKRGCFKSKSRWVSLAS